ncbi:MAG: AAA family ATPase [Deltaproteobacteria bacterium]|nr:AAA family ATPase [Deltaproteobacteria bacterium]
MRIHRLHIKRCQNTPGFKNLIDFKIDFDSESPTSVLVGRNGTGKSNILEALTIIYRDLDLEMIKPEFGYSLEYNCHGHEITVDADPDRKMRKIQISADGKMLTWKAFKENKRTYLPNFVFGYYSGPSDRMKGHFIKHQEKFYNDLINSSDEIALPLRPLFFAQNIHSQFVLLSFFLEQDKNILKFLNNQLGIVGLDSVLFVMKEPPWESTEGNRRFWKAKGVVSGLLDRLYEQSLAPMRHKWRVPLGFRKNTTLEHIYLYLPNSEALQKLKSGYGSEQDFFKALESTYISDLIREVRTRVKARFADEPLTFRELSEGEQQLLMVLGLLRFTREDESLFLLDEPDTHLNPAWSVQYLEFLKDIGGLSKSGHVIMATHDPLVISGLTREQVRVMFRDTPEKPIRAEMPDIDPRGMGVNGLLRSELYGLRSALDLPTLEKIEERDAIRAKEMKLKAKGKDLPEKDRLKLIQLSNELAPLGFTRDFRDPIEQQFADAMARRRGKKKPIVLTPEELEVQEKVADEILEEILAEEKE